MAHELRPSLSRLWKTLTTCRLCRHVTGAVFVAILVVEAAILIFSVHSFERDRLAEIEREGLAVVRAWLEISGESPKTLIKMSPMIGEGSVLLSAQVLDQEGREMASLEKYSIMPIEQDSFSVTWQPRELGHPYQVRASLDKSEVPKQIIAFIWRIIGLVLLLSVIVTLVTMIILERLMLRPIRHFRGKMQDACADLTHVEKYALEVQRKDELGDVALAFNDLLRRLGGAFGEIHHQQKSLRENNAKLESEVTDRTRQLQELVHDLRREASERERAEQALDASGSALSSDHLRKITSTDTLTGLANRELFMDRCTQVLRTIKRKGGMSAVLFIDLDDFNKINQSFGQRGGDAVLQTVAQRLTRLVRESDTLARLSADEFALILLDVEDADTAAVLAQRITEQIQNPIEWEGSAIQISSSIGITVVDDNEISVETVVHHAGLAMKRAKADSGPSYHFYAEEMNRLAMENQEIERDLKLALERKELEVFYQPKLDVHTDQVKGMEALVRWHHPEKGFVSPGVFIPVAERTNLILELGEWVLRQAARQSRKWMADGVGELKVAVNVSAVQLRETCMVTLVRQVLLETGLPPHLLELEITESAVMEDVDHTISVLENLRELGVSLSIDDFGTGYSSLNYLKRFPVKRIKIDKAFVDEIENSSSEGVIARAVITMGHSFGMEITAEGVEHAGQHAFLKEQGCDEIQGFLFGKPMNATDFETFMTQAQPTALAAE